MLPYPATVNTLATKGGCLLKPFCVVGLMPSAMRLLARFSLVTPLVCLGRERAPLTQEFNGAGTGEAQGHKLISQDAEKAAQGQAQPQLGRRSVPPAPCTAVVSSALVGRGAGSFCRSCGDRKASGDGLWGAAGALSVRLLWGLPACSCGGSCSLVFPVPTERPRGLLSADVPASPVQTLGDTPWDPSILQGDFFFKFNTFHLSNNNGKKPQLNSPDHLL